MTCHVTLVVQSVLTGVFSANPHLRKAHLSAPGNDHMVDVDGIMPWPEDFLVNPKKPTLKDQGFHQPFDMARAKAGDASDARIGNLGVLTRPRGSEG